MRKRWDGWGAGIIDDQVSVLLQLVFGCTILVRSVNIPLPHYHYAHYYQRAEAFPKSWSWRRAGSMRKEIESYYTDLTDLTIH